MATEIEKPQNTCGNKGQNLQEIPKVPSWAKLVCTHPPFQPEVWLRACYSTRLDHNQGAWMGAVLGHMQVPPSRAKRVIFANMH